MTIKNTKSLERFIKLIPTINDNPFFTYTKATPIEDFESALNYMIMTENTLEDNHKMLFVREAVAFESANKLETVKGAVKFHLSRLQMLMDY